MLFYFVAKGKTADNGDKCNRKLCNKTLANIKQTRFEHLQETKLSKKGKMQVEKRPQWEQVQQKTLQKSLANIKRTRFEHLQKQNFRKKAKNRMKNVRCRKTRAYRLTKSTPSAKCWFYRLSKPQKGKLSLSNKHGKIADKFFALSKNMPADNAVFPHCAEILI